MFSESDAYERFMGRWSRQLAPVFLEFAAVPGGGRVLDVGSGTGALASSVLASLEPRQVVGIDPSPSYVNYAGTKVSDPRATFEQGDAQRLRFPDAAFDATLSLLVVNFIPDAGRAVDEMVRVTRPGGVVAAPVWDYGDGMEMLRLFWDEAVAQNPSSEPRDERHMPFSRAGELASLWRGHRLSQVTETALTIPLIYRSFDDFWQPFLERQGPAGAYVASLPDEGKRDLEDRLRQRLEVQPDGSIRLNGRAWAVNGVRR